MLRRMAMLTCVLTIAGCKNEYSGEPTALVSCEEMCAARAGACGVEADCVASCQADEATADELGCADEYNARTACVADRAEVCGDDLTAACAPEEDVLATCKSVGCGGDPTSATCIDVCAQTYAEIESACGWPTDGVAAACQELAAYLAASGCAAEQWALDRCRLDLARDGVCYAEVIESTCQAELAAFDACTQ